jgi:hypothetical protein
MRKSARLIFVGVLLILICLVDSEVAQHSRESAYRAELARFQHDLHLGTDRAAVKKYLESRNVIYEAIKTGAQNQILYQIKIGEDPGSLVCEP